MPPKLTKKQLTNGSVNGTGASAAGKASVTTPKMTNFSPQVGSVSSLPVSKPKASKRPSVHPVQRP